MKNPNLWHINDLLDCLKSSSVEIEGHYYPARPIGLASIISRLKLSFLVFTGKADALVWPKGQ